MERSRCFYKAPILFVCHVDSYTLFAFSLLLEFWVFFLIIFLGLILLPRPRPIEKKTFKFIKLILIKPINLPHFLEEDWLNEHINLLIDTRVLQNQKWFTYLRGA